MRYAVRAVLVSLLVIAAWREINWINDYEPGPDSSIFMSMGWHMTQGRVLYKDVWDHKPPMISVLNGLAFSVGGDDTSSIHTMERLFAIAGVLGFFLTVYLAFGRFWLAWLTSALYLPHFYQMFVLELGNVTEEYGAVFFVGGMAAAVASVKKSGRNRLILTAISGLAFSLAVLSKEPFLVIAFPWFLFVAWPRGGDWKQARRYAGVFLLGALLPFLILLAYLGGHGAIGDWIDAVAFNLYNKAAAGVVAPSNEPFVVRIVHMAGTKMHPWILAVVGALLGIAALSQSSFVRRYHGLPIVVFTSAVLALLATSLGGGFSGHYYLFLVPSFVLLAACGLAFVADFVSNNRVRSSVAIAVLLVVLAFDAPGIKEFARFEARPTKRWPGLPISEIVRRTTRPGDLIWAPWKPLIYVEAQRLSPTKYHFAFEHLFIDTPGSTAAQKLDGMRADLERNPPRVIVLNIPPGFGRTRAATDKILEQAGLMTWLNANYQTLLGSPSETFQLLTLKTLSSVGPTSAPKL